MFLLLTLEKHKDGVWVTRLVEELVRRQHDIVVQIATMEGVLHEKLIESNFLADCRGIINRVSDAADPENSKRCIAILSAAARVYGIPVFNGPSAYSLCCNKWCHHAVFARAGLASPSTVVVLQSQLSSSSSSSRKEGLAATSQRLLKEPLPHLIKPNSGGFGAGIVKIVNADVDSDPAAILPPADDTLLLQTYVPPAYGKIYRVWFLLGRVQCAVERTVAVDSGRDESFTTGCSGSNVCSRRDRGSNDSNPPPVIVEAWTVPVPVREEIERMLELLQEDGHAGSVEFLIDATTGQRLYFDLNLLSTLPNTDISNAAEMWGEDYNPWAELADAVIKVFDPI